MDRACGGVEKGRAGARWSWIEEKLGVVVRNRVLVIVNR